MFDGEAFGAGANDTSGRNPKCKYYEHHREHAEFLPCRYPPWFHEDHAKPIGQEKWRSKARAILRQDGRADDPARGNHRSERKQDEAGEIPRIELAAALIMIQP
jgi:hypothetical protein